MLRSRVLRLAILFLILGGTAGCDQAAKHVARSGLGESGSVQFPGGFGEFRLAENPGSFLSLGASLPEPLRLGLLTLGVGLGLLGMMALLALDRGLTRGPFIALALIWAGGTSNLIDRIARHGLVTDFIFVRIGPFHTGVFNLADVAILAGLALLAHRLWRTRSRQAQPR
jgi:signal peptidase II